ncbi:MAG TPA: ATP-binding cassette domain-containing protein [Clostridia bacterium]|nr:ATP-binding cassette domain-containing protein [Clostridia bacterium]
MDEDNLLTVLEVTKSYTSPILQGLSLYIRQGERIGILGPSGSGKTTLLRLIAGLEQPDSGSIIIDGVIVSSSSINVPPHLRGIGYVFQSPALWPHMTVEQNILYPSKEKGIDIEDLLNAFQISELTQRYPSQISGGQAKRVAIARALAAGAKLLLMDEPLTNLEKDLKIGILATLNNCLDKTNTAIIYVTHDMDELQYLTRKNYGIVGGGLENA